MGKPFSLLPYASSSLKAVPVDPARDLQRPLPPIFCLLQSSLFGQIFHILPGESWAFVQALTHQFTLLISVTEDAHVFVFINLVHLAGEAGRTGSLLGFGS